MKLKITWVYLFIFIFLDQNGGDFDSEDMMPLPEGTLNRNLGLDLIVVVTKTG